MVNKAFARAVNYYLSSIPNLPPFEITSSYRTKEENDALPNSVPNSYHLTGQAFDIVFRDFIKLPADKNFDIIYYTDGHYHIEPSKNYSGGYSVGLSEGLPAINLNLLIIVTGFLLILLFMFW